MLGKIIKKTFKTYKGTVEGISKPLRNTRDNQIDGYKDAWNNYTDM